MIDIVTKGMAMARYEAFGATGNASKLLSLDLEEMVKRYDSGKLDSRVG
jgi:fructose-bisphosphate aldolase class II